MSGYQVVIATLDVPNLQSAQQQALCGDFSVALGGGALDPVNHNGVYITSSWPTAGSKGWEVAVYNPGKFAETEHVQVYAICAQIGD